MRWPLLAIALTGCTPSSRVGDGVMELDARSIRGIAGDSTSFWLISHDAEVAVRRYSFDGEVVGGPVVLADRAWSETIAANDAGAVAVFSSEEGLVFAMPFDRDGTPRYSAARSMPVAGYRLAVAMSPDGGSRILLAGSSDAAVTLAEIDASAALVGSPVSAGTRDANESSSIAIGTRADGTSVLAWDRTHDRCFDQIPFQTFTTTADAALQLSPLETVRDQPERDETAPVIAARDDGAYVAWAAGWQETIAVARATQLQTPIEIHSATSPRLALASSHDGAIAWMTSAGLISVATFDDDASTLALGEARLFGRAFELTGAVSLVGLVHAGDRRYVLVWSEGSDASMRSFARIVDFDAPAGPRPEVPAQAPRIAPPCSH